MSHNTQECRMQVGRRTFRAHKNTPRMALENAAAACLWLLRDKGRTLTAYSSGSLSADRRTNSNPANSINWMPACTTPAHHTATHQYYMRALPYPRPLNLTP